jgi:hypothetical protein
MLANNTVAREKVGKVEMDFMAFSCICLPMCGFWLSKSAHVIAARRWVW